MREVGGYEGGVRGTINGNGLFLLLLLAVGVVLCYLKLQKKVFLHRQKSEKQEGQGRAGSRQKKAFS